MKFELSVQLTGTQQWYDVLDNLTFESVEDETTSKEESSPPGEELQGRVRIGCTIDTSPGTSEVCVRRGLWC